MSIFYRIIWRDWHNGIHQALIHGFDDAVEYATDILESYTSSLVMSFEAVDVRDVVLLDYNPKAREVKNDDD